LDIFWGEKIKKKTGGKMRLFIALVLPDEVKDNLFGIQKYISPRLASVNWVSKKKLHITLKFLGEVQDDLLDEVIGKLSKIDFSSAKLKFNELEFFKNNVTRYGIMRLNVSENKKVHELHNKIDETLLDLFSSDQKFTLHTTLGRIKNIKKQKEFLEKVKSFQFYKEEFVVSGFYLIQSFPARGNHIYKVIRHFKT